MHKCTLCNKTQYQSYRAQSEFKPTTALANKPCLKDLRIGTRQAFLECAPQEHNQGESISSHPKCVRFFLFLFFLGGEALRENMQRTEDSRPAHAEKDSRCLRPKLSSTLKVTTCTLNWIYR